MFDNLKPNGIIEPQYALKELVAKYGRKNAVQYYRYCLAGIPEKFWDIKMPDAQEMHGCIFVTTPSINKGADIIGKIIMRAISIGHSAMMVRLEELLSVLYSSRWNGVDVAKLNSICQLGAIGIYGIRESLLVDKNMERLVYILDSLSIKGPKKIIAISAFVPIGEDGKSMYDGLLRYLNTELGNVNFITK